MPPLAGVELATLPTSIGYEGRDDIMMATFAPGTVAAGVLTQNSAAAAPVLWTRQRLQNADAPAALLINAGNANCYTGRAGHAIVRDAAGRAAECLGATPENIYICSTGRIGLAVPPQAMLDAISTLSQDRGSDRWHAAAKAIMTTDRWPKAAVVKVSTAGGEATLYGIAKGTSMIAPNMATTINAVFTDAKIDRADLQSALDAAVVTTYNSISVDETTSTNDSLLAFATGAGPTISGDDLPAFQEGLRDLLHQMSQALLADARKDGRLVECRVTGAESDGAARKIARSIACSLLLRRVLAQGELFAAEQSSAGRILAAAGGSLEAMHRDRLAIRVGGALVLKDGEVLSHPGDAARNGFSGDHVEIEFHAGVGQGAGIIWTVVPTSS
jgi:glutamate N-acetyltransferase/amino-acid N-acetyltransferase